MQVHIVMAMRRRIGTNALTQSLMHRKVQSHYLVLGQEGAEAGAHTPVTVCQTEDCETAGRERIRRGREAFHLWRQDSWVTRAGS